MSGVWRRSYGRPTKAPPDERGGNRHGRPNTTAPHPDSTRLGRFPRPLARSLKRAQPAELSARAQLRRVGQSATAKTEHDDEQQRGECADTSSSVAAAPDRVRDVTAPA